MPCTRPSPDADITLGLLDAVIGNLFRSLVVYVSNGNATHRQHVMTSTR